MSEEKKQDLSFLLYLLLSAFAALLCLVGTAAFLILSDKPGIVPVIAGGVLLILCEALVAFLWLNAKKKLNFETDDEMHKATSAAIKRMDIPVVFTTVDGKVIWFNNLFAELSGKCSTLEAAIGRKPGELFAADAEGCSVELGGKRFITHSYIMPTKNCDFWMTVFADMTDLDAANAQVDAESPVICYAVLDNMDKLSQLVKSSFRTEANKIETALIAWAGELDGFVREYDRDKYLISFPRKNLQSVIDGDFAVLDKIKTAGIGEGGMYVTVSMGIACCGTNLKEREAMAAAALETALQRGGDQVVLRDRNGGLSYYGGKTKSDSSRTRILSRTACDKIIKLISDSSNVIIMGHSSPDFDCIGGCVGLYRMAKTFNENVKIVTNKNHLNFRTCTRRLLEEQPEYASVFISGDEGMDMLRSDTLLIIADANNMSIVECPDITKNVSRQIIIDHHRKLGELEIEPEITLIEPGTSSCCELVSEMLELASVGNAAVSDVSGLSSAEADVLLAGIMLDTKNFTRSTGEETFAAAMFLKSRGADSERVRNFFDNGDSEFVTASKLGKNLKVFLDCIAIAGEQSDNEKITGEDRIAASNVAESMLSIKNIDASFAMIYTEDAVLISARSNGKINVQLIMEKMGGGGRYDAAGAQISGKSFSIVSGMLRDAITEYMQSGSEENSD